MIGKRAMQTIVITNQKGGVGKTAIAVHLAQYLEEQAKMVLFIDLDTQGNSSRTLSKYASGVKASELFGKEVPELAEPEQGITLIEADRELSDLEQAPKAQVFGALRRVLPAFGQHFDYCIIDTPPSAGLRVLSALMSADYVLCPIELDDYSIDGITQMLQTVFGIRQSFNPGLSFLGMLANRYNTHSPAQKVTLENLLANYAEHMVPAKIGNRSSIPEALRMEVPVWRLRKTAAREAGAEMLHAFEVIGKRIGL